MRVPWEGPNQNSSSLFVIANSMPSITEEEVEAEIIGGARAEDCKAKKEMTYIFSKNRETCIQDRDYIQRNPNIKSRIREIEKRKNLSLFTRNSHALS